MDSHKLSIKFFAPGVSALPDGAFVPVFHSWIQEKKLADHLLIDVADYAHVPEGPGTLIVTYEANIHMDFENGQPGLLYVRKQPAGETFSERLQTVLRSALSAATLMEKDARVGAAAKFDPSRAVFRIHDRLNGPNRTETFDAIKDDLLKVLTRVYGAPVKIEYHPDPERLFTVQIQSTAPTTVNEMLARA